MKVRDIYKRTFGHEIPPGVEAIVDGSVVTFTCTVPMEIVEFESDKPFLPSFADESYEQDMAEIRARVAARRTSPFDELQAAIRLQAGVDDPAIELDVNNPYKFHVTYKKPESGISVRDRVHAAVSSVTPMFFAFEVHEEDDFSD